MDKGMTPAGVFRLKDGASMDVMPAHSPGGPWQVWKMPDGRFMARPLTLNEEPWRATCMLDAREFKVKFESWRDVEEDVYEEVEPGPADEPDILILWYEQALAAQKKQGGDPPSATIPEAESHGGPHEAPLAPSREKGRPPFGEAVLDMYWDPNDFFFNDATNDHSGDVLEDDLFSDVFAHERLSPEIPLDFLPDLSLDAETPPASEKAVRPAPPLDISSRPVPHGAERGREETGADFPSRFAGAAVRLEAPEDGGENDREIPDAGAYAEAMEQRLERRMREEFSALLERFDNEANPDIERGLSRLLLRDADFSWKQKFMFTEFGFALRRRRLHKLALISHNRALVFSPADEHVLFNVARSEYELGNVEKAKVHLSRALEKAPTFDAARRFFDFLNGGVGSGS